MRYSSNANPFLSRRTYHDVCEWWQRTTVSGQLNNSKMAHLPTPSGKFHAKAVTNFTFGKKEIGDIRLSNSYVTVETPDDVSFLRTDDLVRFHGIMYRVDGYQKRELERTNENMRFPLFVYEVQLVR